MPVADTGFTTADITNLLSTVAPPGSGTKTIDAQTTKDTKGGTETTTVNSGGTVTQAIGGSTSTVGPHTTTQNIGGSSSSVTHQQIVDPAGVTALVNQILSSNQGLAATAGQQHAQGGYNTSTNGMLLSDLISRTAGEAALLNKKDVTTTSNSGSVNTILDSGYTTTNSGSTNVITTGNTSSQVSTAEHTDTTTTDPYSIHTTQVPQISGKVAAGIAAGTLLYNALGQVITKGTGKLVDSVTGAIFNSGAVDAGISDAAVTAGANAAGDAIANSVIGDAIGTINADGAVELGSGIAAGVSGGTAAAGTGAAIGGTTAAAGDAAVIGDAAAAGESTGFWTAVGDGIVEYGGEVATFLGWVICTELTKQYRLPKRFYIHGAKVFDSYPEEVKLGYYLWAIPSVKHLRTKPNSMYSKVLESIMNWRAEYIAANAGVPKAKKTIKGFIVLHGLYYSCHAIGSVMKLFNIKRDYNVLYTK